MIMRGFLGLAVATAASFFSLQALALPLVANPGGLESVKITLGNTINGTTQIQAANSNPLKIQIVNNLGSGMIAYVTGKNSAGASVMLQKNGQFYVPNAGGNRVPVKITADVGIPLNGAGHGETTTFTLPDYITSGRVWVGAKQLTFLMVTDGTGATSIVQPAAVNPNDPSAGINWGFVELTYEYQNNKAMIYANISYVDFVGMIMGMAISFAKSATQNVPGLQAGAVAAICNLMKQQSRKDGQPWGNMCISSSNGTPLRVLSPNDYISEFAGSMSKYYDNYVNQVWSHYTNNVLTIDTQEAYGKVKCQVSASTKLLTCAGDNRGYTKPSTADIFGCNSGPFLVKPGDTDLHKAVIARLCAAFDRTTLLLPGGNVQPSLPSSSFYSTGPSNFYSQFVHKYENNGIGYAFAYDDVNPAGENQSGEIVGQDPTLLKITIGGPK